LASGSWGTIADGISGNNIVGIYYNSSGTHGFLYDGSTYTTLDDPLGQDTYVEGISGNTIVGWYGVPGYGGEDTHGFIATVPEPSALALLSVSTITMSLAICRWRGWGRAV
jgi:hypothetical protein